MTYCKSVLLSHCQSILLSHCQSVLLSHCQSVLLSHCHSVLLSHTVNLAHFHDMHIATRTWMKMVATLYYDDIYYIIISITSFGSLTILYYNIMYIYTHYVYHIHRNIICITSFGSPETRSRRSDRESRRSFLSPYATLIDCTTLIQ